MNRMNIERLESGTMNRDKKIEVTRKYIMRPTKLKAEIKNKKERLEVLNAMATRVNNTIKGMPSGSRNPHSRESIIAKKLDLEKEIQADSERLAEMEAEVMLQISTIKDAKYQKALVFRFINGKTNDEVADRLGVDIRSVQRYVEKGCLEMKLPERYFKKKSA